MGWLTWNEEYVSHSPSDMCTKTTESGKIEYKYETFNNVRPPYRNEFQIWGHAKNQYFYHGGHICSAITAFLIFGHISTTNWYMITSLVSNTMFSGSRIPMEPFKIQLDQYYSGITGVYHRTTLYLTRKDIWENFRGMTLGMFQTWTYIFNNYRPILFPLEFANIIQYLFPLAKHDSCNIRPQNNQCRFSWCSN